MHVNLASCNPLCQGAAGQGSSSLRRALKGTAASLAGTRPSSLMGRLSAVEGFDVGPNLFHKKVHVARKSSSGQRNDLRRVSLLDTPGRGSPKAAVLTLSPPLLFCSEL